MMPEAFSLHRLASEHQKAQDARQQAEKWLALLREVDIDGGVGGESTTLRFSPSKSSLCLVMGGRRNRGDTDTHRAPDGLNRVLATLLCEHGDKLCQQALGILRERECDDARELCDSAPRFIEQIRAKLKEEGGA